MVFSTIAAIIAGRGRMQRPAGRTVATESEISRPMQNNTPRGYQPSQNDRQEPTDDYPELVAHDVSDTAGHPLIAFYDPDGSTMDGEILYARATVNVEANR
jgi:hypothetical protein